jgi:hypothetical protein
MEYAASEQPPEQSLEQPTSAPAPTEPESALPARPKRKTKAKARPAEPAPSKRANQRAAVPPSTQVDHAFSAGLLARQRATFRANKQVTFSKYRIFA